MLNPYLVPGNPPATRKSVVALLDVLGFTQRMKAAYVDGGAPELLTRFRGALDDAYLQFKDKEWERIIGPEKAASEIATWQVKAFTDNIVIGFPIYPHEPDAEGELGSVLLAIRDNWR